MKQSLRHRLDQIERFLALNLFNKENRNNLKNRKNRLFIKKNL